MINWGLYLKEYWESKILEYEKLIAWINKRLSTKKLSNSIVANKLKSEYLFIPIFQLTKIKQYLSIQGIKMNVSIQSKIHVIDYYLLAIICFYLPGLYSENSKSLLYKKIVRNILSGINLNWIKDLIVRLDNSYATFPSFQDIPIFFIPPYQTSFLFGFSAVFHEIGHNIFNRFENIKRSLKTVIINYYNDQRISIVSSSPQKRKTMIKEFDRAEEYWIEERISELFCDIFAAYLTGPVFYYTIIDLGIKTSNNPFNVDNFSKHPPAAARCYVCRKVMDSFYKNSSILNLLINTWKDHTKNKSKDIQFSYRFSQELLDNLQLESINLINKHFPTLDLFDINEMPNINFDSLSNYGIIYLLNKLAEILILNNKIYSKYEKKILSLIKMM